MSRRRSEGISNRYRFRHRLTFVLDVGLLLASIPLLWADQYLRCALCIGGAWAASALMIRYGQAMVATAEAEVEEVRARLAAEREQWAVDLEARRAEMDAWLAEQYPDQFPE